MAFIVPSFNLLCDLWTYPAIALGVFPPVAAARAAGVACALVDGRRISEGQNYDLTQGQNYYMIMHLLLPPGTDIRGRQDTGGRDTVECPTGSGRWYSVEWVDDIGKGWANEHRTASLVAVEAKWAAPYP